MRTMMAILSLSFIVSTTVKAADSPVIYGTAEFYGYSEALPYPAFIDDWDNSFEGGKIGLVHSWLAFGVKYKHWGIEVVRQSFTEMRFSKSAAEFYYLTENKLPLEAGRQYNIQLKMKQVSLEGVRLFSQIKPSHSFSSQFGVTLLRGRKLLEGEITGYVTAQSENDFHFDDVQVNYFYSNDIFLNREVNAPNGLGYSFDASIHWRPTHKTMISLNARNIFGRLYWNDSPFTRARITSNNKTYDENGYVTVSPGLSGKHEEKNVTQTLPRVFHLMLSYQTFPRAYTIVDVLKTELKTFVSTGVRFKVSTAHQYTALYRLNTQGITLEYSNSWLTVGLTSDALSYFKAKDVGLNLSIAY